MKIFLILIVLIIITSCDNSTNPVLKGELIPLLDGNQWIYQNEMFDSNGKDTADIKYDTAYCKDLDSAGLFLLENLFFSSDMYRFKLKEDGLYFIAFNFGTDSDSGKFEEYLFLKYPAIQNAQYEINRFLKAKVVNSSIKVKTEAGTFNCINYLIENPNNPNSKVNFYVSPDVGLVMTERFKRTGDDKFTLVQRQKLVKYTILGLL